MGFGLGMGGGWLFGLLLLVGVVLLVVVAARSLGGGVGTDRGRDKVSSPGRSRARELLDERYARGEIDSEEYRQRLRTLDEAA